MDIRPTAAMEVSTEASTSQSEPPAESQPAASHFWVPTFEDFSCHYEELQQVQAGTLSESEFNRRRASEVAASQRASVARSPSVAAQRLPSTHDPAPPAAPELSAGQQASVTPSLSATARPSLSTRDLTVPATVSPAAVSLTVPSPSLLPLLQVQPAPSNSPMSAPLSIVPTNPVASNLPSPADRSVRQVAMLAVAHSAAVNHNSFA